MSKSNYRVLIASRSFGKVTPDVFERLRRAGCEIVPNPHEHAPSEQDMLALVRDIDVIVSGTEPITAPVIAAANQLKGISKHGVGYENIDLAAAKAAGVPVCIAGGTISNSVADMAMALLLALARQIPSGDAMVKQGRWGRTVGIELAGKTLGIVGLGQIGKAVCHRALGFEMQVIAFDTYHDDAFAQQHAVDYVALPTLLQRADFVSLHAPGGSDTHALIDATALAQMKPTAYLINTARGELIDEAALYAALRDGRLAGAACDVFCEEPPAKDNPLLTLPNFIAAPHSAGQTKEGLIAMGNLTCDNALALLRGEAPKFRIV